MKTITDVVARWRTRYWIVRSAVYYRLALAAFGSRSLIIRPILITGGRWIRVGSRTSIRNGARLEAFRREGEPAPTLLIGDRVLIEQDAHIVCSVAVTIEDDVAIAARCTIVDTEHPLPTPGSGNVGHATHAGGRVRIGRGSMLGVGTVVLPGVTIGERSVVGANSVVANDLPAGCVAAGAPARVIRMIGTESSPQPVDDSPDSPVGSPRHPGPDVSSR